MLIFSILILGLVYASSNIPAAHATGTLYISPADQGPVSKGSIVTYNVKVANMDPFNYWDVMVTADPTIINDTSISIAGNVLTANFTVQMDELANCINGVGIGCTINDGGGRAHSIASQGSIGSKITGPVNGLLFTVSFKVTTGDMSKYALLNIYAGFDVLINAGSVVSHGDVGAIYGNPPQFPMADFTWSPTVPFTYDSVNFTAVNISDPNLGATIKEYSWNFLAGTGIPKSNVTVTSVPAIIHVFPLNDAGNASVTLTVKDSLGITSIPVSHTVTVKAKPLVFPIVRLAASRTDDILPGTIVNVTVSVNNDGNQPLGNFNVTLVLPSPLGNRTFHVDTLPKGKTMSFSYQLDTSAYKPDVYEVLASIPPLPGQTELLYNNAALELRVIYSNPGGLQASLIPLSIPEFLGLLIAGLVGLGVLKFIVDEARRRRRLLAEELA